ncbi:MAG: bifunctional enoyl-CoA hydratase/phosphate acetyltransferase, partial [Gammaproteobacteria bacterium]
VDILVKGSLPTGELLGAILHRDNGIRTDRRISHAFVIDSPAYHKLLVVTDAAINIEPDLAAKRDIVQNAIDLMHSLGVVTPKVALLSALEFVNPNIPSTVHAAALCKMADRKQITGAVLDGPLALDNAISKAAAKTKGIVSPVAGDPDVLVVPELESGNMLAKQFLYFSDSKEAGVLLGARVPVVLTSRSEGALGRLYSCAIAVLCHHHGRAS